MDCCNYMQYRHHQPYYGSQYYDPLPAYHGEYYGQQMYQEYYGNSPYYPQQWQCATSFPDYVYNPKEARIRKAMRDATRERSIGTSPMVPRPNARRAPSHSWVSPHNELMMPPLGGMEGSVCGYSPGDGHYMGAMSGYTKMDPTPMSSSNNSVHTNYMQSNPLAQLQQQTEMWPEYRSTEISMDRGFIMGEVENYSVQNQEMAASIMMEKEPTPPTPVEDKEPDQQPFLSVFEQTDDSKMKKPQTPHNKKSTSTTNQPLPDFNEAFGSTERGRFQRLAPNKGYLNYFFDGAPIKFDDYQI